MAFFEGSEMTGGYGNGPDIINSCTVNVNKGEIVSILGPNGAGKSTAMKAMLGLLNLKSGSVTIDGKDISLILTQDAESPRQEFLHYTSRGELEGLRQGNWKLLVKRAPAPRGKNKGKQAPRDSEVMLFDLSVDVGEQTNLATSNPEIVDTMKRRMVELDSEIEANARSAWEKEGG